MPQPVLALGCAVVTAAGSVWYLPAVTDLRAGPDRPLSRRTAALACLTGWGTLGAVALVLFVATAWWVPATVVAVGGTAAGALWAGAALRHAGERRETARQWAQLPHGPLPAGAPRPRAAVAALAVAGPVAGAAATAVPAVIVTVPALVVGVFLVIAVRHTRTVRRAAPARGHHPH
ncbi:hypothetical protein ACG2OD_12340 [Streptomyces sp. PDY-4]|uniref:hypothetical protein n=1 Tax=Streptomyces sp. PDY-4 TaxID=3376070 RepID=UPI0037B224CE